ncbi:MAG TPA: dihydrodipicolinate synthase family protein [Bryobacteraceae bacterium]|nr:dihydrodipicolinate synthase family protein [Bryobacteraceae bacterium]
MSQTLFGVYPIANTPFHPDGSIDFDSQDRLIDYLLEQGAHGIGLFGNASEGYALSGPERTELMRRIAKRVNGRVPLVASSGHTGTDAAVELSKEMEDLGADCLMVLPPYFLKTDGDGLMYYFSAISRAVKIPIMVQDAPLMTQVPMPAALLARMGREIENVRYVKVEAPPTPTKFTAVAKQAAGSLTLFGGLNCQFFIEEWQRGARGQMPGSDRTRDLVAIWDLLEAEKVAQAWDRFLRVLPLLRFELQPGLGVSAQKHSLVAEGVISSAHVRHPTASLEPESVAELAHLRELANREEPALLSRG